ncbi:TerB family tellurite resistance protein [Ramlibacter pallidus]|uniref:TerB family tellurite resistance protein n=1 Tax=Ramlibacter pallidus TaxID=2780087 RepID=A0ABR9S4E0_9BURK|nr:TerB family tellurite resistance protein [Ramlibacter pallidus]MBE7368375.1 TerB family tellurite resistance protein [Ramlibacter pallidus]
MLRALKDLFDSLVPATPASAAEEEHALQLATAVLLVEVMRAEPDVAPAEREAVLAALRRKFTLSPDELARLMEIAEEKARAANDFFAFTSTLNERFSQPQKVRIIEFMWLVAYADGALGENENHVISKVAGLLHVTHGEYIAAKLHARQATGLGAP